MTGPTLTPVGSPGCQGRALVVPPSPRSTDPVTEADTVSGTVLGAEARAGELVQLAAAVDAALAPTAGSGTGCPVVSDGPQAQGDVIVLPWDRWMSPHIRHRHVRAAGVLPRAGVWLLGSHLLLSEIGAHPVRWLPERGTRPGLGTLVVPEGTVARLAHDEHADLRIGPGVYVIRRQRIDLGTSTALVVD